MIRKKLCGVMAIVMMSAALMACGGDDSAPSGISMESVDDGGSGDGADASEDGDEGEAVATGTSAIGTISGTPEEVPDGMYLSELTGEPIPQDIEKQRPIAVMVDNEKSAFPHYGIAEGDVMYEIMNSTLNARITRLMVLRKDWQNIKQMGNIRSTRPTNILLAAEWNAVLCHDGGPYYINTYFDKGYLDHFSGIFSRVNRPGYAREFTEFIVPGDLDKAFGNGKVDTEYNEYANEEPHFSFVEYGTELTLDPEDENVIPAETIKIPLEHNKSELHYNADTRTYDYYTYGSKHTDAEDSEVATYKNVILQNTNFAELDDHGYLIFDVISPAREAYYITNGHAIKIYWIKPSETGHTKYYTQVGEELQEISINTGKTYITLVPEDQWGELVIE